MKKWLLPIAAATIIAVGCGGSGSSSVTAGSSATGGILPTDSVATVNIPNTPGVAVFDYLTGSGRAAGDLTANIQHVAITSTLGGTVETRLQDTRALKLNAYNQQFVQLDVPPAGQNSLLFTTFNLQVANLQQENADGSLSTYTAPGGGFAVDQSFPAAITVLPGRQTAVPIRLNELSLFLDPSNVPTFDRTVFLQDNTSTENPNIEGHISDYITFDISHVATRPRLDDGTDGVNAFFSGDRVGISGPLPARGTIPGGSFQVFTPLKNIPGILAAPTIAAYGTYTLQAPNPTDASNIAKISSLAGIWRKVIVSASDASYGNSPIAGIGAFEVILLPHSADANVQDAVAFTTDGTNITNFYYGTADLTGLTISLFPIANIQTGDIAGEITGTLSGLVGSNGGGVTVPGSVRAGRYSLTGTLPSGFKATGKFLDFRL